MFVSFSILSLSDPILIGLSKSNSQYTWPDGEELTYSNWDIGQPLDISLDFACVIVNGFDLSKSSRWKIGSCDVKYTYLCTSKIIHALQTHLINTQTKGQTIQNDI